METAYIGLGSNIGDRAFQLSEAIDLIRSIGEITAQSHVYETKPHDVPSPQGLYLNMVIALETVLRPNILLEALLLIEMGLGRVRSQRNDPRIIDLDILFYGSQTIEPGRSDNPHPRSRECEFDPYFEFDPDLLDPKIDSEGLVVPHPRLHEREFVLAPLSEISPNLLHPKLGRSVSDLLAGVAGQGVSRLGTLAELVQSTQASSSAQRKVHHHQHRHQNDCPDNEPRG